MILEKLIALAAEQLDVKPEDIRMETRLKEDLGADSASVMMLVMDIESAFDITIDDDAIETVKTVGDLVSYIEAKQK